MVCTKEAEDEHGGGEQKQGPELAAALVLTGLVWLPGWLRL
jgi:hypothetical protein